MGAVSGLAVGTRPSGVAASRMPPASSPGAGTTGALWALGWVISYLRGIDAAEQWAIFGPPAPSLVTFVQSTFIERVLPLQAKTQKVTS